MKISKNINHEKLNYFSDVCPMLMRIYCLLIMTKYLLSRSGDGSYSMNIQTLITAGPKTIAGVNKGCSEGA